MTKCLQLASTIVVKLLMENPDDSFVLFLRKALQLLYLPSKNVCYWVVWKMYLLAQASTFGTSSIDGGYDGGCIQAMMDMCVYVHVVQAGRQTDR